MVGLASLGSLLTTLIIATPVLASLDSARLLLTLSLALIIQFRTEDVN